MKLKICGMKYADNMIEVAKLQPDYLGFIFYNKSARFFDSIIPKLPNTIKKTGVFVNATISDILNKINVHQLDAVQLHGDESPEFCKTLRDAEINSRSHQIEIIKVFSIKNEFDFSILESFEDVCDYYLFDTKGKLPGGNGYTFNWKVLKNYPFTKPFFLSGGIGIEEVEALNSFFKTQESKYCFAIDVNSKFELEPGLKDIELLKEFKSQL
ncbi:phosphoribosylanthranilate isomerase [Geojedonia litorea]|uniref:N-(5'-phosphoribosyl)anthranilate isomerase n=1 Tax=Geojedonia litorea TaxID=1268269 RepID=A0ABV9N3C2_9FLAO